MERSLLKYIWGHSRRDQLWMLVVILASMPTYFLSLELPKRIVNSPIQGVGFETPGATSNFLETYLPFGEAIFGEPVLLFAGFEMERISFLFALSTTFLALVVANGLFKLYINTYKGRMGERILRRMRYELFDRVMRYPLSRFRRTKASEVASMIKDEVEPMGEYIGDAFTQPLFLGGQALVALLFIFLQNFWLGVATFVVVAFQAWLIPLLRKRLIELQRQRQIAARKFAGRLGEIVEGIQEAHTNDTTNYHRSEISNILSNLFFIRFELFQRKFMVKFINNFLIQFLAFFFYAVGGYLAIKGTLDIGQLIGVIVAYKDLPAPVRGLIDQDQKRLTVEVRYAQIIEQFDGGNLREAKYQELPKGEIPHITKGYEINRLSVIDDTGSKLIENASTEIKVNEKIAVVGDFNSGASNFAEVIAGVIKPTSGRILMDDISIDEQPEYLMGRRIGYIDGSTYFPQGTILDVLTYVLKNQPVESDSKKKQGSLEALETKRSGNYQHDFQDQWLDYNRLGFKNDYELIAHVREILIRINMENDIRALGLRGTIDPVSHADLARELVEARKKFRDRLDKLGFSDFVEPFDPELYNNQASVGENLLFGTAVDDKFRLENLPENELVIEVLKKENLESTLFEMGKNVAATTLELFGDLNPEDPFFDQLTYMNADELPEYKEILSRIGSKKLSDVSKKDYTMIIRLPLAYTEEKNRLGLLPTELKDKILAARANLRKKLEELKEMPISFYETDTYNEAATIQDNVLLGRISSKVPEGTERVTSAIRDLLEEMDLTDDIFNIGLSFNIGSGGKRLTEIQRQKLHLARTLLKKPDILIANQAMNALSTRQQEDIIETVLEWADKSDVGIIWVPMNASFAQKFERILVFDSGNLVADGSPEKVKQQSEVYNMLTA